MNPPDLAQISPSVRRGQSLGDSPVNALPQERQRFSELPLLTPLPRQIAFPTPQPGAASCPQTAPHLHRHPPTRHAAQASARSRDSAPPRQSLHGRSRAPPPVSPSAETSGRPPPSAPLPRPPVPSACATRESTTPACAHPETGSRPSAADIHDDMGILVELHGRF